MFFERVVNSQRQHASTGPRVAGDALPSARFEEGDVAWRNIQDEYTVSLQLLPYFFDHGPSDAKLLPLFLLPRSPSVGGELRRLIKAGPREIQDKRRRDDRHLDRQQRVVEPQQSRNVEPEDLRERGAVRDLNDLEVSS